MTWMDPNGYRDIARCDYCEQDFIEDDLIQIDAYVFVCDDCFAELAEDERQMREMAEDDKAHAEMDKRKEL